jgi:ankyrin repeat protein
MSGGDWKELFNAACEGDLALVQYHVKNGVDVNYAHPEFLSTPLVACILAGQEVVAHHLLDHGANPRLHSEFDGMTPVEAARHVGMAGVLSRLARLGIEPSPPKAPRRRGLGEWLSRWLSVPG